jgi:hypothetical protein
MHYAYYRTKEKNRNLFVSNSRNFKFNEIKKKEHSEKIRRLLNLNHLGKMLNSAKLSFVNSGFT